MSVVWSPCLGARVRSRAHDRVGWPVAVLRPDYAVYEVSDPSVTTVRGTLVREAPAPVLSTVFTAELRPTTRQVFTHLVDPHAIVMRRRAVTGGLSPEEFEAGGADDRGRAVAAAVAAVARLCGLPVVEDGNGAEVVAVRGAGHGLRAGDVAVAVDRVPVSTAGQFGDALAGAGRRAVVRVRRPAVAGDGDGDGGVVDVPVVRDVDGRFGVRTTTRHRRLVVPWDVSVDLPGGMGGPSLGLAVALSVLSVVGSGVGAGGPVVATGEVGVDGSVGPVGGVVLKARAVAAHPGVRMFLVPAVDPDAVAGARKVLESSCPVVPVSTLAEAARVLDLV